MMYSDEIKKFIANNVKGIGNIELANKVNKKFGTEYTANQIRHYKNKHHLSSGLNLPMQEKIRSGYPYIRTEEGFKPKSLVIYEEHYGKLEDGYVIVHLDNNPKNCEISNLVAVKKSQAVWINRHGYAGIDKIITECAVNMAKLREKINRGE